MLKIIVATVYEFKYTPDKSIYKESIPSCSYINRVWLSFLKYLCFHLSLSNLIRVFCWFNNKWNCITSMIFPNIINELNMHNYIYRFHVLWSQPLKKKIHEHTSTEGNYSCYTSFDPFLRPSLPSIPLHGKQLFPLPTIRN